MRSDTNVPALTAASFPKETLPRAGERVICAVSGGLDSMVLLHLLWTYCRDWGGVRAAHFNHRLRPTADRDEQFVRDWCRERGIPFRAGAGDVAGYAAAHGLTTEEAARLLRLRFLREAAAAWQAERVYTAHHLSDNAETVLWNLVRGTGVRGLAGMHPLRRMDRVSEEPDGSAECAPTETPNGSPERVTAETPDGSPDRAAAVWLVRPLLDTPRAEIAAYAAAMGIPHVEDETNADPDAAARNYLRLNVLPLLRDLNPRADAHIADAAQQLAELDDWLEADAARRVAHAAVVRDAAGSRVGLPVQALSDAPPPVRPRMLLALLDRLGAGRKDVGAVHLRAVLDLCGCTGGESTRTGGISARTGGVSLGEGRVRRLDLPHGVTASVQSGQLTLARRAVPPDAVTLRDGVPVQWNGWTLTLERRGTAPAKESGIALRLPADDAEPIEVRPCGAAERLCLDGKGRRTVKRLCLDRRIPLSERDTLPAFYVGGTLAAVWKLGTDTAFRPEGPDCLWIRVEKHTGQTEPPDSIPTGNAREG